jgi:thiol:disulfide interchange protein DsbD
MVILKKFILFKIFLFFIFSSFLNAKNIGYASNSSAEIIHDIQSLKPSQEYLIGVKFNLDPGWHTYWKNPGDSGEKHHLNGTCQMVWCLKALFGLNQKKFLILL